MKAGGQQGIGGPFSATYKFGANNEVDGYTAEAAEVRDFTWDHEGAETSGGEGIGAKQSAINSALYQKAVAAASKADKALKTAKAAL